MWRCVLRTVGNVFSNQHAVYSYSMVKKCTNVNNTREALFFKLTLRDDIYPRHINKNLPVQQCDVEREPLNCKSKHIHFRNMLLNISNWCNTSKMFVFIYKENRISSWTHRSFLHWTNIHRVVTLRQALFSDIAVNVTDTLPDLVSIYTLLANN